MPDQPQKAASRWERWKFRLGVRLRIRCSECGLPLGHLEHPLGAYGCPVHGLDDFTEVAKHGGW